MMSPKEIQAKQFHVRFRGFDVEEVDGFLEEIAEHYLLLIEEKKTLASKVELVKSELAAIKNEEHSFKDAMISAQRVADEMHQRSKQQATALLEQARKEAEELKQAARQEIAELKDRVAEMHGIKNELHEELRQIIGTYQERVEQTFTESQSDKAHAGDVAPDEVAVAAEEPDLGDLYEKVDLGPVEEPLLEKNDLPAKTDNAGSSIPDLDDEVMFTLEDPLDKEKIDVPIDASGDEQAAGEG
ncbi:MAG: DivIVA domain-containing protein [Deltaproteobacteria bacterium]|nr:DivIVA domain-containing protein [Deltaproteobacteria bacterium]